MTTSPLPAIRSALVSDDLTNIKSALRDALGALLDCEAAVLEAADAVNAALSDGRDGSRELADLAALAERHDAAGAALRAQAADLAGCLAMTKGR